MGIENVSVVCGTYGTQEWAELAYLRALPSVPDGIPFIHRHADTLAEARNLALAEVQTDWVVHLDADDELEPGFFDGMRLCDADIRAPAIRHVYADGSMDEPLIPRVVNHDHACVGECLRVGNWIIVGAMVRTELIRSVGGWELWPIYEDYALWARCWLAGGVAGRAPEAVYRQHIRDGSRNQADPQTCWRVYEEIRMSVFG